MSTETIVNQAPPNTSDATGAQMTLQQSQVSVTGNDPYGFMSYMAAVAGPTAAATAEMYEPGSAEAVNAAVNASAGYTTAYGTSSVAGFGTTPTYGSTGSYVSPTSAYTSTTTSTATSGSTDLMTMANEQLAETQASSIQLIMLQDAMGSETRFYTATSNLMSSRDNTLREMIRKIA